MGVGTVGGVEIEQAARRWAETWSRGWREHDTEAIVALQAEDGVHWSSPFRPAHEGRAGLRAYVQGAFDEEVEQPVTRFAEPVIQGDQAAFEYWALCTYADGPVTISGCTVARFGADGLVVESRDYSFSHPGHHTIAWQGPVT